MAINRKWLQRLFNLPADKEKSPTVLSLGGILYVGGGADTDGQVIKNISRILYIPSVGNILIFVPFLFSILAPEREATNTSFHFSDFLFQNHSVI